MGPGGGHRAAENPDSHQETYRRCRYYRGIRMTNKVGTDPLSHEVPMTRNFSHLPWTLLTALMLLVLAPDKAQAIPTDATEKSIQGLVGDGSGP